MSRIQLNLDKCFKSYYSKFLPNEVKKNVHKCSNNSPLLVFRIIELVEKAAIVSYKYGSQKYFMKYRSRAK